VNPGNLKAIRKAKGLTQEELANKLGIKVAAYSKLERGLIQLTVDRLITIAQLFDVSPQDIISYHKKDKAEKVINEHRNVTYVPVTAQAGWLSDFSTQKPTELGVSFSLPVFYENDLFLISLEGDSMYPTFCNGDFLVIRQLGTNHQIKWGEPHLIITSDGQVVKRVMKAISHNKLILKSDNELYQSYEIEASIVLSIWEVKGVISKNLAPRILRKA